MMRILRGVLFVVTLQSSGLLMGASFTSLGFLTGDSRSGAYGVSANGNTVVGYSGNASSTQAVMWKIPAGPERLGAGDGTDARSSSADGDVIVGWGRSDASYEAFRWTQDTGIVRIGDLPGGEKHSGAADVSSDGSVIVGTSTSAFATEAFRWTADGGMIGLGLLPGTVDSASFGVSADGRVVVGEADRERGPLVRAIAFRWTLESGMTSLGDLLDGNGHSTAYDVSADGSIIIGISYHPLGSRAFRWTADTGMVALPNVAEIGEVYSIGSASGISGDGQVIVGHAVQGVNVSPFPFVWDVIHGTRNLAKLLESQDVDLMNWELERPLATSHDSLTIVGVGRNPLGQEEGWIVQLNPGTFVPEPRAVTLVFVGILTLVAFARRSAS
jgi:probable HAF family extracellular repeat protein